MSESLVFDSSVLSGFARAQLLGPLRDLTEGFDRLTTQSVLDELKRGASLFPLLDDALSLDWLQVVRVDGLAELIVFTECADRLGSRRERNVGEASVLAWADVNQQIALIDDGTARQVGLDRGVAVHGSLWLMARGVSKGEITMDDATGMIDSLVAQGGAYLPCSGEQFASWAAANGLLPPQQ